MKRAHTRLLLTGLVAIAALAVACDEDLVDDATFHLWCGDKLCTWDLEQGHVRRVPTWHEADYGVELVDTPTAISQYVDKSPTCVRFTSVARVDERAQVSLEVDFNDDGTVDFTYPIPTSDWHQVETLITPPPSYAGVRFRLVKHGDGVAQLAMLRVQSTTGCNASQAVKLHDLPIGDKCGGDGTECRDGVCCLGICSQCCSSSDSPICTGPNCAAGCAGGAECKVEPGSPTNSLFPVFPLQCGPGEGRGVAGAPCVLDVDCVSGACDGVVFDYQTQAGYAPDGRDAGAPGPCTPAPDAGPYGADDCRARSVRGGTCR